MRSPGCFYERLGSSSGSLGLVCRRPLVAVAGLCLQAPAGRAASPEEIAAAIAYLASDDASFVHGVVLPVDGGRDATWHRPRHEGTGRGAGRPACSPAAGNRSQSRGACLPGSNQLIE